MAEFRLKMATQLGEKVAAEFGFRKFPVDPFAIARTKGISVHAKPAEAKGVSGALIFAGGAVSLIYSTEFDNVGFQNFSVAHELGHYFLPGHPDEILKSGGTHLSRANFTQGTSIELEADHFASGLLMPFALTVDLLAKARVGIEGIFALADEARCSRTAAAIRAAECGPYPMAVVVSQKDTIAYAFLSEKFKNLGKLSFLRKGTPLPFSLTRQFNASPENILHVKQACGATTLQEWFDGPAGIDLDEEVVGLGSYGFTLTVLTNEQLPSDPDEEEDEDARLEESWKPKFAYGR
jgi:hypothetical protein